MKTWIKPVPEFKTYLRIAIRKSKFVEIIVNPTAVSIAINDDNSKSRLLSDIFSDIFSISVILFDIRLVVNHKKTWMLSGI